MELYYRPEIDGLRALAVLSVIAYHAGAVGVPGGFLGVDVFFVISGYLITSILLRDIEAGSFSFWQFYERRARRILPAFLFMLIASSITSYILMIPSEFEQFSGASLAATFFVANHHFANEIGYFQQSAELSPLLHTWSLAVEEQFYILFPAIIFFGIAKSYEASKIIVTILIASIVISLMLFFVGDNQKIFYFAISRAWELMVGALCAIALRRKPALQANDKIATIGLILLMGSIFLIDKTTPFPFNSVLAVIGSALLICFTNPSSRVGGILSLRPVVLIGLISYSAYLFHQPILAFARIGWGPNLSPFVVSVLVFFSLFAAYLGWRYVETPFRQKSNLASSLGLRFVAPALALCLAVGLLGKYTNVAYAKYNAQAKEILWGYQDFRRTMGAHKLGTCFIDYAQDFNTILSNGCLDRRKERAVILFGDSHAAHWSAGLNAHLSDTQFDVLQYTGASCRPFDYADNTKRCKEFLEQFSTKATKFDEDDYILLAAYWAGSLKSLGSETFRKKVENMIERFSKMRANIVIVLQMPAYSENEWIRDIIKPEFDGERMVSTPDNFSKVNRMLIDIAKEYAVETVDPGKKICSTSGRCETIINGRAVHFDRAHLSEFGSKRLSESIVEKIKNKELASDI